MDCKWLFGPLPCSIPGPQLDCSIPRPQHATHLAALPLPNNAVLQRRQLRHFQRLVHQADHL